MFENFKLGHKILSIQNKWLGSTGIDPGDGTQILNKALEYVKNLGFHPEDAWLTALVNWMDGMPSQNSKNLIAQGIINFLNEYEGKIALSSGAIINARAHALVILSESGGE
jgi:hypothetical protein